MNNLDTLQVVSASVFNSCHLVYVKLGLKPLTCATMRNTNMAKTGIPTDAFK